MSNVSKELRKWAAQMPEGRALQAKGTAAANTPALVENLQGAVVIGERRVRGRVV